MDARADLRFLAEIEGRARNRSQLSGGDKTGIDGCIAIRVDGQQIAEDVTVPFACQIEVAVIAQIDDGILIGGGGIVDLKRVLLQRVTDVSGQRSRKTLVAIRADQGKLHALGNDMRLPNTAVKPLCSAVQAVPAFVLGDVNFLPSSGKAP